MLVPLWAGGLSCGWLQVGWQGSYLIEVSHILTVLQDPGVEGLPWVGERGNLESDLPGQEAEVGPLDLVLVVIAALGSQGPCRAPWDLRTRPVSCAALSMRTGGSPPGLIFLRPSQQPQEAGGSKVISCVLQPGLLSIRRHEAGRDSGGSGTSASFLHRAAFPFLASFVVSPALLAFPGLHGRSGGLTLGTVGTPPSGSSFLRPGL